MSSKPAQQLTLFDSTCLIVGIIIGVGIYQMAPDIAKGAGGAWGVAGLWVLGGLDLAVRRAQLRGTGHRLPAGGRRLCLSQPRLRYLGRIPVRLGATGDRAARATSR